MTYKKEYIGKGKVNSKINSIVKYTFALEDLKAHSYDYQGTKYVSVEVTEMKEADKFGRTHTAWVSKKVEEEAPKAEAPKKPAKPKK